MCPFLLSFYVSPFSLACLPVEGVNFQAAADLRHAALVLVILDLLFTRFVFLQDLLRDLHRFLVLPDYVLPSCQCPLFRRVENLFDWLAFARLSDSNSFRVENNGFEPLTPCLQSRCSSQLS